MADHSSFILEKFQNNPQAFQAHVLEQNKNFFIESCVPNFEKHNKLVIDYCKKKGKSESGSSFLLISFIFILGVGIGILIYYFISKR